jgi:hypothetical protein
MANTKDKIKELYKQVQRGEKQGLIESMANEFGLQALSISNNWFTRYWAIPVEYQSRVVEILKTKIKSQKKVSA